MKKAVYTTLVVALFLLMTGYIIGKPVSAQVDFDAYKGAAIADGLIDGVIGTEWDDGGHYTGVTIDPMGTAEIWTKHDGTNLYFALRFTADSNNPWIAIQLGRDSCMDNSADGALFGHDSYAADGYADIKFDGVGPILVDSTQNGVGAMTVVSNLVTIELKKPLNSGDAAGNDITWLEGSQQKLVIAWDSNGGGSSGGTTNHRDGGPTSRTIFIDPNPIPEFPGWVFIAVLLIVTIPAIVFAKRIRARGTIVQKGF